MKTLWRSRFFAQVRKPVWMGFLLSNEALWIVLSFFNWPYSEPDDVLYAYIAYFVLTVLVLLVRLCRDPLGQIVPLLIFILVSFFTAVALPFVNLLGFEYCMYPEKRFIRNHCRPVSFEQDKKTYFVGLCDVRVYPDSRGQLDFAFLYDTSGDVLNDEYAKYANHALDRREWVDAIRKGLNDNPNEPFEFTDFSAYWIDHDFYKVTFDPDANALGFTEEYGPPPYNPKNPYHSIFHADPKAHE